MKKFLGILFISALTAFTSVTAQEEETGPAEPDSVVYATKGDVEEIKGAVEGLNESYLETKTTVEALKKLKVSGYIQAQFQSADKDGAKASYSGGDFPSAAHSRFMVRRGRVKFNYDNDITQYVLQLDATEKGVGLKDAYVSMKEPWLRAVSLTAGVFDRPFGFEISYSSSSRETPERSRLFQTLFPGERDLGAKIEIGAQDGPLSYLNLKAGLFSGNGIASETDNHKDFIGRLGFTIPLDQINLAIDGGVSAYIGKVKLDLPSSVTSNVLIDSLVDGKLKYKSVTTTTTPKGYKLDKANPAAETGKDYERTYIGGDLQFYYDLPVLGGFSLRGEYIQGKQPGTASSSSAYKAGNGDLYMRNFSGYYINYIQNIGLNNQFVLKYDVYDPNTDVKGSEIGPGTSKFSAADLKYSTLGLGWIFHYDANVKFLVYYDMVTNEKVSSSSSASLSAYRDDIKDNVFTFRVQYKF